MKGGRSRGRGNRPNRPRGRFGENIIMFTLSLNNLSYYFPEDDLSLPGRKGTAAPAGPDWTAWRSCNMVVGSWTGIDGLSNWTQIVFVFAYKSKNF